MAQETTVNQLKKLIEQCTSFDTEDLVRNPDWGSITFDNAKPDIDRVFSLLKPLATLPIEILPQDALNDIAGQVEPVKNIIAEIRNFKLEEQQNPSGVRDNLVNQLGQQVDQLLKVTAPWLPYLAYQRGDIERNIGELNDAVEKAKSLHEAGQIYVQTKKNDIEKILTATREAAATVGVAHFTEDFSNEASSLENSARRWLITSGILATLTALGAVLAFFFLVAPADATTAQIIQYTTTKVVLLGLLFAATVWCGSMYRATKHQVSVNRHRANALKTFQAFTQAASNDTVRDAVLMETTRAIFTLTPSGLIGELQGKANGDVRILEFVKGVTENISSEK